MFSNPELGLCLRKASVSDLDVLLDIKMQNFPDGERLGPSVLKAGIESGGLLLAELKGQPVAFLLAHRQSARSLRHDQGYLLRLHRLSVHPDFQQQGMGSLLLTALKEEAGRREDLAILLSAPEALTPYYIMNGFAELGPADAALLAADMFWASQKKLS